MKKLFLLLSLNLILCILYSSCTKKKWKCDETPSYKTDIQPLLSAHCGKCHSWDNYADAKALAVNGQLKDKTINTREMPPAGEQRLTNKQRKKIFCWIEQGAMDN